MTPLRILSIIEGSTLTGPIRPLLGFARQMAAARPQVVDQVLATTVRRTAPSAAGANLFVETARGQGTRIEVIEERRAFDPGVIAGLQALIGHFRPDVLETHSYKPHFLVALLRMRLPGADAPRWIAFHHGYTTESLKVRLYNQLDRWSLRRADRVVTLCRPFAEQLRRARGVPADRISVIKNPVEARVPPTEDQIDAVRAGLGIAREEHVVLSVGRLSAEKGHADLIEAFGILLTRPGGATARLVFVGDGPEGPRLARLAKPFGNRVVFAGQRRDVGPYYGMAKLFALPSHTEGSPLVLLEAIAAGLPVVATTAGGIPETVAHEQSALLVPPRAPSLLAAALERLLLDRPLAARLVRTAGATLQGCTPAHYAASLQAIYEETLARAPLTPSRR